MAQEKAPWEAQAPTASSEQAPWEAQGGAPWSAPENAGAAGGVVETFAPNKPYGGYSPTTQPVPLYQTPEPESDVSRFLHTLYGMTTLGAPTSPAESAISLGGGQAGLTGYRLGKGLLDLIGGIPGAARYWQPRLMPEPSGQPPVPPTQTMEELSTVKPEVAAMLTGGLAGEALGRALPAAITPSPESLAEAGARNIGSATKIPWMREAAEQGVPAGAPKSLVDATALARDFQTAKADLSQTFREMPPPAQGPKGSFALAKAIGDRAGEVWDQGHKPQLARQANVPGDTAPVVSAAYKAITPELEHANIKEVPKAEEWIADELNKPRTLGQWDKWIRNINNDLESVRDEPYGPTDVAVRIAAVRAARQMLDDRLVAQGEAPVHDYNVRFGALANIKDQFLKAAYRDMYAEGVQKTPRLPVIGNAANIYAFLRHSQEAPLGVEPFVGMSLHPAGFFTRPWSSVLAKGAEQLGRAGLEPPAFPGAPTPPIYSAFSPAVRYGHLLPGGTAAPVEPGVPMTVDEFGRVVGSGARTPSIGPITPPYRGEVAGSEETPTGGARGYPTAPQPTPEGQSTAAPTPISFAGAKAPLTPGDIVTLASRVAREAAGEGAPATPVAREPIFDISRIRQEEAAMRGPKAGTTISLSPQARELLRQILAGKK